MRRAFRAIALCFAITAFVSATVAGVSFGMGMLISNGDWRGGLVIAGTFFVWMIPVCWWALTP
jgi:hypothetical protein